MTVNGKIAFFRLFSIFSNLKCKISFKIKISLLYHQTLTCKKNGSKNKKQKSISSILDRYI